MIYFTSDSHYFHQNIIKYSSRPFNDVDEMTEGLVNNYNLVVKPDDTVYHLGDFIMSDKSRIKEVFPRLNGKIHLIRGNHDLNNRGQIHQAISSTPFASIKFEDTIEIDGVKIYMRHEPKMDFTPSGTADYHLCGHVHESFRRRGNVINVGVDVWSMTPRSLKELLAAPDELVDPTVFNSKSHRGY